MNDRLEADPAAMGRFAHSLTEVNARVTTDTLHAGAGTAGLAENKILHDAMLLAHQNYLRFLGECARGFQSIRAVAVTCHNDYVQTDGTHALEIASTLHTLSGQKEQIAEGRPGDEAGWVELMRKQRDRELTAHQLPREAGQPR